MNGKHQTRDSMRGIYFVLALVGSLLAFNGWAGATKTQASTEAEVSTTQGAPDASATGSRGKSWWQKRQARRKARVEARSKEMAAGMQQPRHQQAAPAGPLTDILVAFKLDPRLTRGLYMGDRWVAGSSGVQGGTYTAEASVQGVDANGRPVEFSPKWVPSDPEMVTVTPSQGSIVAISVTRPGQSSLKVTSEGVTRTLTVKAEKYRGNALKVDITQ